jgi:hypothetical protein
LATVNNFNEDRVLLSSIRAAGLHQLLSMSEVLYQRRNPENEHNNQENADKAHAAHPFHTVHVHGAAHQNQLADSL